MSARGHGGTTGPSITMAAPEEVGVDHISSQLESVSSLREAPLFALLHRTRSLVHSKFSRIEQNCTNL